MTLLPDVHRGGSGSPLVLLHGINLSWKIWRPVIPALELNHTVIAPTLAGHLGGPGLPAGPLGIGPVADAVEALLDEAGLAKAHLVGNSLGGWLALELAQRGRALSVVALSPAGAWTAEQDFRRLAWLMRLSSRSARWRTTRQLVARPRSRRLFMRSALERGDLLPTEVAFAMLEETRACLLMDGLLAWIEVHGAVRELNIPTDCRVRLAWPERDRTIPYERYGRPYRDLIPGSELITMPGVGHVPMYDDPELVARTILAVTAVSPSSGRLAEQ
ncbi:MAG: hypothetical protein JWR52_2769 [Marmoricola sp.]|nr:hypothetical protein [Marmoricola sp.]